MMNQADLKAIAKNGHGDAKRVAYNELRRIDQAEVDRLACQLIGSLASASSATTRRKALEKARRMLGNR